MSLLIREFRPADAEAVAEVRRATLPHLISTADVIGWQLRQAPAAQRLRLYVAERDGVLAGFAKAGVAWESSLSGRGFVQVAVDPARRGRGTGGALLSAAEEHLRSVGVDTMHSSVSDDEVSRRFAERRGYRLSRPSRFLGLALDGALPPVPAVPAGVELRSAAEYENDPRPFYEADVESSLDEPGDLPADAMSYDSWIAAVWNRPDLDRKLTIAAVVDGTIAAFSAAQTDGRTRYWSAMTGTLRTYRGRGLAKLAKTASLHRARAAGYTEAYTSNDDDNAPMIAINSWLGYQPRGVEWSSIREPSPA
jgi:GNAT superfamily N-acetyltransferase